MKAKLGIFSVIVAICMLSLSSALFAQETGERSKFQFKFEPSTVNLQVGETADVQVQLLDENGTIHQGMAFLFFVRGENRGARRGLKVEPRISDDSGSAVAKLTALAPGTYRLSARTAAYRRSERYQETIPVEIAFPPLEKITFLNTPAHVYEGTTITLKTRVFDKAKLERKGAQVQMSTSNQAVASVDPYGNLTAHKQGTVTLTAAAENVRERLQLRVVANPVTDLELSSNMLEARTGDVIHFAAAARDGGGKMVADAPIHYSFVAEPEDNLGPAASAQIEQDGRFVAEVPGIYTIVANSGPQTRRLSVRIGARDVAREVEIVGHGLVDVFTSDLWVWQGVDGRDYAVTGTHRANGEAYFWDVTDPSNLTIIDTIKVDARTVNDVKVSEDGRICVISREGASNRRNGIVILDVTNPHNVEILSRYDEDLTGGVHNVFVYDNHVYAVNNGRRYDIINIEDPKNPYRVGRFELDSPGHGVHDVWVVDGIAYSSNWQDGLVLVDVGTAAAGGPFKKFEETPMPEIQSPFFAGGSPSNPVKFASYEYPSGWNHAAFPYYNKSTDKFYVIAGDEAGQRVSPYARGNRDMIPPVMAGWFHFVDFTDPKNPKEVARFEVPDAGAHNLWVQDDILYAAYYNAGLRVVDISGELMGNLYRQGREIARFLPTHAEGPVPNAPFVWGPQPYKGMIYLADYNSGLWVVKLVPGGTSSD